MIGLIYKLYAAFWNSLKLHSIMAYPSNMTYAGRIYQNPTKKEEIWFNIGWNSQNNQRYPDYESWLSPYITIDAYKLVINAVKEEFDNLPFGGNGPCLAICSFCLCSMTLGVCFCPLLMLKKGENEFRTRVEEAILNVGKSLGVDIKLKVTQAAGGFGGIWMDSSGLQLFVGRSPGGPPLGYNIILKLPTPVQWPPSKNIVNSQP